MHCLNKNVTVIFRIFRSQKLKRETWGERKKKEIKLATGQKAKVLVQSLP